LAEAARAASQKIDIQDYWRIVWRRKWVAVSALVLSVVAGLLYSLTVPEMYAAQSRIMSEESVALTTDLRRMFRNEGERTFAERVELQIKSREFLLGVALQAGLDTNPLVLEQAADVARKFPDLGLDGAVKIVMVDFLGSRLGIRPAGNDVVQIVTQFETADGAVELNDLIREAYLERVRTSLMDQIEAARDFTGEQRRIYESRVQEVQQELEDFEADRAGRALEGTGSTVDPARLDQQIAAARQRVSDEEGEIRRLDEQASGRAAARIRSASILTAPSVADDRDALIDLEEQYANLVAEFGVTSANAEDMRAQTEERAAQLQAAISLHLGRQFPDLDPVDRLIVEQRSLATARRDAFRKRQEVLETIKAEARDQAAQLPREQITHAQILERLQANQDELEFWDAQYRVISTNRAFQTAPAMSSVRTLDPATKPYRPYQPDRVKIGLVSALLGMMIAFGSAFLLEYMDRSFKSISEIEAALSLPVLGIMPTMAIKAEERRERQDRLLWAALLSVMSLWIVVATVWFIVKKKSGG
jgi:uncharacterized protein involved in exopolysaccharide biosynthesis